MCGEKSESDAGRGQIGEGGLKKEERRESDRLCPKFDKQAGARGVIVGLPAPSLLFNLHFPLPNDEAPPQERSAATSLIVEPACLAMPAFLWYNYKALCPNVSAIVYF